MKNKSNNTQLQASDSFKPELQFNISQSDLVDIVIAREQEKLEKQINELKEKRKEVSKKSQDISHKSKAHLIEVIKTKLSDAINLNEKYNPSSRYIYTIGSEIISERSKINTCGIQNELQDYRYDHEDLDKVGGVFAFTSKNNRFSVFKQLITLKDKDLKEFNKMRSEHKQSTKDEQKLTEEIQKLEQEVNDVKNNVSKVKSKLITKFLENSEEGKNMLAVVNSINTTKLLQS